MYKNIEPGATLHGGVKSMILDAPCQSRQSRLGSAEETIPAKRVGDEAMRQEAPKGRFYALKSVAPAL
ncbi:MAG: hypothetical protein HY069_02165 [Chlamydiia bacterium]|nr:hypothetical protein [Chlamydiia bacterium]